MLSEWYEYEFRDLLVEPVRNGLYKPKEFHGRGAKIINMGELFAHPRLRSVEMKRVDLTQTELKRFSIRPFDLLFARRSLVADGAGKCSIVLEANEPTTFESSLIRARVDREKANAEFLYYLFASPQGAHHLDTILRHVAVAGITGKDLMGLKIKVPDLNTQEAIAQILSQLDNKIELNRKMNETLEAMARALFKSWFVDFDPVRAKAEGRPTGLPAPIAALFPDSFENSELGEIPKGWSAGKFGDVADNPRRGVSPDEIKPDTPYIALEHMPKKSIALNDWGVADGVESGKLAFNANEILFGKLRPYFHKVGVAPVDGVCSTDIVVIAPRSLDWLGFVLGHASSSDFVEHTNAGSTGTKMPRTNWGEMARYQVVLPPNPIAKAFTDQIQPAISRIVASSHENHTLAALRESLLPKLISGEVRLTMTTTDSQ